MDPMVDLLILMGFLSALFCVLGAVAGMLEWCEARFRRESGPLICSHPPKTVGNQPAEFAENRRLAKKSIGINRDRDSAFVVSKFDIHHKAA